MSFLLGVQLIFFAVTSVVWLFQEKKKAVEPVALKDILRAVGMGLLVGVAGPLLLSLAVAIFSFREPKDFAPYAWLVFLGFSALFDVYPAYRVWYKGVYHGYLEKRREEERWR
ncbi:MAG: hypothetical protein H6727_19110 [Myxococcales bacterium]|nr:hypothetical protein [Myxococcales bacterium]